MADLIEGAGYEPQEAGSATDVIDKNGIETDGPPDDETIVRWVKADIDAAERLQDELRPIRNELYQLYRGKNPDKPREGRSNIVSTEIMNAVEWILPSLMRIYFQSDQIALCEPVGPEDVDKAEQMTNVLNDMFTRRQKGFVKCLKWFKDALVYGLGVAKETWEEEYEETELFYEELPEEAFNLLEQDPSTHIDSYDLEETRIEGGIFSKAVGGILPFMQPGAVVRKKYKNVRATSIKKTYEGIHMDILPLEDYLYDPAAEETEDCAFQIHKTEKTIDECLRLQEADIYKNIEELINIAKGRINDDDDMGKTEEDARFSEDGRSNPNDLDSDIDQVGRLKVPIYEWWGNLDIDGNGKLKPYVVCVCEDTLIRCEPNPYNHQLPPFITLRPMLDIHKFEGIGLADLLKDGQKAITGMTRQYLDNLSWQNNGMWLVDRNARVELSSLLHPRPAGVVRSNRTDSVKPLTPPNIGATALQGIEFMRDVCEAKSGVTRYTQGLDAKSLNKTATGITAIMNKSDGRVELIARTFAETGVRDFFTMANSLVQQYMTMDYAVRVYGKPIQVAPDDVKGNFDISVSVGTNPGRQEQVAQQMIQLLSLSGSLIQNGVMTPDNLYYINKKLLECWGHKDVEHYLTEPQVMQKLQQTIAMLRQQLFNLTGVDPLGQQQNAAGMGTGGPGGGGIPQQMPQAGSQGFGGSPSYVSGQRA